MNYGEAKNILDKTFNQENFNEKNFKEFIYQLFAKNINIHDRPQSIDQQYQSHISSCKIIGDFVDSNKCEVIFLIVNLSSEKSLDRARTLQRNFIAEILQNSFKQYAIVAFVGGNQDNWRFSLVKLEYNLITTRDNKLNSKKELSPSKRLSFLVGKNEGSHTVKSQFQKILNNEKQNIAPTIAEIEKAFNIEAITDEFFEKYKELDKRLREALEDLRKEDEKIKNDFIDKQISDADFAKKTLGQIVFLYFLQKKGWFGVKNDEAWGSGDKNFLRHLFNQQNQANQNFFNDVLKHVFYEALATDRGLNAIYNKLDCRMPFLNGGLFEPMNGYAWETTKINIPNQIFSNQNKTKEGDTGDGIFDIFDRYNFTVNENEPLEQEVAVDPEMLGKVFENLLEIKDRKSKGAFYTPREIVHYMCQESLINYLHTQTNLPIEPLSNFIKNKSLENIENSASKIDKLLANVKVCDPAVGSGAFMLGMLNEIVNARLQLDKILLKNSKEYDLKLHAISNSIYGVDLDSGAVEIAKLRLWLALVVEEEIPFALPNLDHKIMQGNSLLEEYEGIKLFDDEIFINHETNKNEINLSQNRIVKFQSDKINILQNTDFLNSATKNEIKKIDKEINLLQQKVKNFNQNQVENNVDLFANNDQSTKFEELRKSLTHKIKIYLQENQKSKKENLKVEIDDLKFELISASLKKNNQLDKLSEIKFLRQKNIRPFFIWKLEFCDVFSGENPGFDIVIGNPPYIQLQKEGGFLAEMFEKANFKSFARAGDIYCLFYEFGNRILNDYGHLTFITSNKWMRAGYGEKLRGFLAHNTLPKILIDLGPGVFKTATVDTNILLFQKKSLALNRIQAFNCMVSQIKENLEKTHQKLEDYLQKNHFFLNQFSQESWIIANNLEAKIKTKIEKIGVKLKDWDIKINYGIKTGFNEAFIIDTKTKEELYLEDPKSIEIIKPILRGRDIFRYSANWAGLWVINAHNGYKSYHSEIIKRINVEKDYPAIFTHLKKYQSQLEKRSDKGEHWSNLRNCAYLEEFAKEKIVYAEIVRSPQFYYDKNSFYPEATSFLMTGRDVKFLVAILNSKPLTYFFNRFYAGGGLGDEGFRYKKKFLETCPIPQIPASSQAPFIAIVDDILSITNQANYNPNFPPLRQKELEKKIDEMVCDLYQLDDEEKKLILGEKSVL